MKQIVTLMVVVLFTACSTAPVNNVIQGKTEREAINVVGKVPGRILKIFVEEGDLVKKGDTLAILDAPEVDAKKSQIKGMLTSANAQYQMALKGATDAQITQLTAKYNALKEQYDFAKKSINRLKGMLQDSLIPQQKYDEAYTKYQGALAQYLATKSALDDAKKGARNEKKMMALGQKERALGALQEVNTAEGERYIIAPKNMSIEGISLQEGELALPGYALFTGYLEHSVYFRFTLPEQELNSLKKGQEMEVTVVYNDEKVPAVVKTIKAIGNYAKIATAYPDYEMEQPLFEVKIVPKNAQKANSIITKTTVTIAK